MTLRDSKHYFSSVTYSRFFLRKLIRKLLLVNRKSNNLWLWWYYSTSPERWGCRETLRKPSNQPHKLDHRSEIKREDPEIGDKISIYLSDPYSTIVSNLTEWERRHEREEFSKLSQVYLHLTTNISSRFTKASEKDNEEEVKEVILTLNK